MTEIQSHSRRVGFVAFIFLIIVVIASFFVGCASPRSFPRNHHPGYHPTVHRAVRARITYYTGRHERVAMNGHRAVQGKTCAAHPSRKFKTKVLIPGLYQYLGESEFEVQDRGRAVTSRKASHGKTEVVDVFVKNYATMKRLERDAPEFMDITIL